MVCLFESKAQKLKLLTAFQEKSGGANKGVRRAPVASRLQSLSEMGQPLAQRHAGFTGKTEFIADPTRSCSEQAQHQALPGGTARGTASLSPIVAAAFRRAL